MPFHSPYFFLIFLPSVIAIFHLVRHFYAYWSPHVLLLASAVFYLISDPYYFPLLVCSIAGNYFLGCRIYALAKRNRSSSRILFFGVLANLIPLATFKYGWFGVLHSPFIWDKSVAASTRSIPIGMSFYTLQQITFLVEMRKADRNPARFFTYALYVAFFAQLVAGPIVRYSSSIAQYASIRMRDFDISLISRGSTLFVFGLTKKVLIADQIGRFIDPIFASVANGARPDLLESWLAAWGYLLQLYFDFSAYSDMAIGIGLMVGIRLPINFNSPLQAGSPSDCISRWHMSLTGFIRVYVFSPLFMMLRRLPIFTSTQRNLVAWAIATITSMLLIGIWHGSDSTFVISGMLIGVTAVMYQLFSALIRPKFFLKHKIVNRMFGHATVLMALTIFGLFFRADNMNVAVKILAGMFDITYIALGTTLVDKFSWLPSNFHFLGFFPLVSLPTSFIILFVAFASSIALFCPNTNTIFELTDSAINTPKNKFFWREKLTWATVTGLLFAISITGSMMGQISPHIYGKF